ncbi:transcription factor FAMA-like [Lycium ferocissimum]|uniref:transcription factor FAMA-like n=1 Tax=Lycium ferocissimum TaxID=112874 RepID=UPI002814D523|nr:transcription factor FAMA-like [Lycium ferocissimum]XP_059317767.1 transcription factor FAMA-like [Lycium ferocissimum]
MEKEANCQASSLPTSFQMVIGETSCGGSNTNNQMVDYMFNSHSTQQQQQHQSSLGFCPSNSSLDKLSFADVMQFADFGPKLGLNQTKVSEEDAGIDPVYFLKFPVLNEKTVHDDDQEALMVPQKEEKFKLIEEEGGNEKGENILDKIPGNEGKSNKRKRPRIKTNEEVESQRMTHIAVERNRRKQMNEHLRVLRSLMPGSYVQRGDQASIIGGAIEFVRELEQLLQCLESQKRRRLYGDGPKQLGDSSTTPSMAIQNPSNPHQPPLLFPLPNEYIEAGIQEETAESKSCLADVEVKLLGFDAMIKILSRRRPGQLIKAIAALEDMQLSILHTNITTIEQTVLYSFNVKISGETRYSADDIANSIQQIFSFIHAEIAPYDVN